MRQGSSSSRINGYTLIEMVVTLTIVSILASVSIPSVKMAVVSQQESLLRENLRDIRSAIDEFHGDWNSGVISRSTELSSENGFPINLDVLVDGVPVVGKINMKKKYLRRIPRDPFYKGVDGVSWRLIGYQNNEGDKEWNKEDVYDVRSMSKKIALNKSYYYEW